MAFFNWNFANPFEGKYETRNHAVSEDFSSIAISTDTAGIILAPSANGKCSVICCEPKNIKHSVSVKDGALVIAQPDERKWYERIGFQWPAPKITVYLPKAEYISLSIRSATGNISIPSAFQLDSADLALSTGSVSFRASVRGIARIKTSTGSISAENMSAGTLDLSATTGRIHLSNLACANLSSNGTTGNILLRSVVSAERLSVRRITGSVKFDHSDAAEILVKTSTGSVTGTLLSEKTFIVKSNTGNVDVPQSTGSGKCEVRTGTGKIKLDIL